MTFGGGSAQTDNGGFHFFNTAEIHNDGVINFQAALYAFGNGAPARKLSTPFSSAITGGYGNAYIYIVNYATNEFHDAHAYLSHAYLSHRVRHNARSGSGTRNVGYAVAGFWRAGATLRYQRRVACRRAEFAI
jgi:hypothetical protein